MNDIYFDFRTFSLDKKEVTMANKTSQNVPIQYTYNFQDET